jgi:hypothetical protein
MKTICEILQGICLYGFGIPVGSRGHNGPGFYREQLLIGEVVIYDKTTRYV